MSKESTAAAAVDPEDESTEAQADNIKTIREMSETVKGLPKLLEELKASYEKQEAELKAQGKTSKETAEQIDKITEQIAEAEKASGEMTDRIDKLEVKLNRPGFGANDNQSEKSAGRLFAESEELKSFIEDKRPKSAPFEVASGTVFPGSAKASTLLTTSSSRMVMPERDAPVFFPERPLRLRDVISVVPATSGSGEYVREVGFYADPVSVSGITQTSGTATVTTAAAHGLRPGQRIRIAGANQSEYNIDGYVLTVPSDTTFTYAVDSGATSPATGTITMQILHNFGAAAATGEGSDLPQASFEPETVTWNAKRIGHWLAITRQTLEDANELANMIDTELPYGCLYAEEEQILYGSGSGDNLSGILTDSQVQVYTESTDGATGDTIIDSLRKASTLVAQQHTVADTVLLNPTDLQSLELAKDGNKRYLWGTVSNGAGTRFFRMNVIETSAVKAGEAVVGAFGGGNVVLRDRDEAVVRVADQHGTFAIAGKVALIAEERVGLQVRRPWAFVKVVLDGAP